MDRLKSSTAAAALPALPAFAAEQVGYFTKGNPGLGTPASVVDDWWLNMMQEEVRKAIVDQGLTPDRADWTQLSQAIQSVRRRKWLLVTGNTVATSAQEGTLFGVDPTAGNVTLTLPEIDPAATPAAGKVRLGSVYEVAKVKDHVNAVTLAATGVGQTVKGTTGGTVNTPFEIQAYVAATDGVTPYWLQLHRSPRTPHQQTNTDLTLTVANNAQVVRVNSAGANRTITLPDSAAAASGWLITVTKTTGDANTVTVQRAGADTINGAASVVLTKQWESVTLFNTGAAVWQVSTRYDPSPGVGAADESTAGIVELADGTEAAALSDAGKAISPSRLGGLFTRSLSTNGYQKLPGGLIIQWGTTGSSGSQSDISVTFPIAFPTACFGVIPAVTNASSGTDTFPTVIGNPSTTGCTLNRGYASGTDGSGTMRWIAVGY